MDQQQTLLELNEAEMAVVNGGGPGGPAQGMCDDIVSYIKDVITQPAT
jgi:hypothetical protein